MLRNIMLMGFAAVFAAAVPYLYERNPELFERAFAPGGESAGEAAGDVENAAATVRTARAEPDMPLGRKVRVEADARGHFVAEFRLNGRRIEALVDTGATTVAINKSTARRIGINLVPADFLYEVRTANGTTKAAAAMIEHIQIGRIRLENVEAAVLDDSALHTTLVGMSFLKRLGTFQVEDGALLLAQ